MMALVQNSRLVLTDSGGLQKEAYFFEKYCITLRDQTEWVELVEASANRLVGADREVIVNTFDELIHKSFPTSEKLYGQGDAAIQIARKLLDVH
jgi:UDP-GlcNAc3NAcA epimerase